MALPVAQADAGHLPMRDASLAAVIAMMVHTDRPAYPAALREVARVLRSGGVFVHVGVHPCFCGGFADRSDLDAIVIRPGEVGLVFGPAVLGLEQQDDLGRQVGDPFRGGHDELAVG
jgi:SAM-dependent methyltransferase